jgi:hypothetical protein
MKNKIAIYFFLFISSPTIGLCQGGQYSNGFGMETLAPQKNVYPPLYNYSAENKDIEIERKNKKVDFFSEPEKEYIVEDVYKKNSTEKNSQNQYVQKSENIDWFGENDKEIDLTVLSNPTYFDPTEYNKKNEQEKKDAQLNEFKDEATKYAAIVLTIGVFIIAGFLTVKKTNQG